MKVIKFDTLKIHIIEGYISNITLIESEQGLFILDCGSLSDVSLIEEYCFQELNRSPHEIKLAVVSHIHPDHAGGAPILREKYQIPIAAHPEIDQWYTGFGGFLQFLIDCYLEQFLARRRNVKYARVVGKWFIKPDHALNDLDFLPGFEDWQVLHLPGHTLHDIGLYNSREKVLYTGDCILNNNGEIRLPIPLLFPDKMLTSLNRMQSLQPSTILFAHGDPVRFCDQTIFAATKEMINRPLTKLEKRVTQFSYFPPKARRELKQQYHDCGKPSGLRVYWNSTKWRR